MTARLLRYYKYYIKYAIAPDYPKYTEWYLTTYLNGSFDADPTTNTVES